MERACRQSVTDGGQRAFDAESDFNITGTLAGFTAKTQCNLVPEQKDELAAVYEELLAGYPRLPQKERK